ncbi:ECF-type sigma factor EcfK [Xanthomonas sp. 3075]|uniref:ECF-type sigma factor EcfK n=1 Tax=Xanthomonas sp. 3075 TaxID=3035315 RepID=UPI00160D683A|nr:ECF-type sigma factor EcfK [Xanthomonas sp. 3075]MBB4129863.1 RNA polymerase sigma factor (TIGR02999 family) [Xanthomonas sp. 3075]
MSELPITELLQAWQREEPGAADALARQVYEALRETAMRELRRDARAGLQAAELVHEAWMRLEQGQQAFRSRTHFYAVAALQMRHLLVDLARQQASAKRLGQAVTLTVSLSDGAPRPEALMVVADAFDKLARVDERKARAFALTELVGFSVAEAAEQLEVSVPTLERDLRFARVWLAAQL